MVIIVMHSFLSVLDIVRCVFSSNTYCLCLLNRKETVRNTAAQTATHIIIVIIDMKGECQSKDFISCIYDVM